MKPLEACRLYTFVDAAYLHGRHPVEVARELCEGGADLVQLRAKDWPADRIEQTASELLPICESHGVGLVINDHPDIAARVGAPFAHLGQEDFFDGGHVHLSELGLSPSVRVGISTHAPPQAARALEAGAAYVAIGPIYATPTKPGRAAVTLDYVRWAAEAIRDRPWFAIGGITLKTLEDVLKAGAERVCVVSAILNTRDIRAACGDFRRGISRGISGRSQASL